MPVPLQRLLLALWLTAYALASLALGGVVLLMFAEALSAAKRHPEQLPVAVALGILLVALPGGALVGIAAAVLGKARLAWLVTGIPAGLMLALAAVVKFLASLWR